MGNKTMITEWKFGIRETRTLRMDPAEVAMISAMLAARQTVTLKLDGKTVRIFNVTLRGETSGDSLATVAQFDVTND